MTKRMMPSLKIGKFIAKVPVIQGGMGVGISLSRLASAVANAGGIGVISSVGIGRNENDYLNNTIEADNRALKNEIRKARSLSNGIIGVNIMVALSNFAFHAKAAIEEGADIIFLSAGLPLKDSKIMPLEKLRSVSTKVIPKVSSARAANIIFRYWKKEYLHIPDAVVIEGPLSGGHQGFSRDQIVDPKYSLENLLIEVVETMKPYEQWSGKKIPVIAAGGIFTGNDIYKYLNLGASGVKMGTRFVTTEECDADKELKKLYIQCKKDDTVLISSPVGLLARVIKNQYVRDLLAGTKKPYKCAFQCLRTCKFRSTQFCIAEALKNAALGDLGNGFAFAGANTYRLENITTVYNLISELQSQYSKEALKRQLKTVEVKNLERFAT